MTVEDLNALLFVVSAGVMLVFVFLFIVVGVDALRDEVGRRKRKGYRGRYRAR